MNNIMFVIIVTEWATPLYLCPWEREETSLCEWPPCEDYCLCAGAGFYGASCRVSTQCRLQNSVCRSGLCGCQDGYSFDPAQAACIHGQSHTRNVYSIVQYTTAMFYIREKTRRGIQGWGTHTLVSYMFLNPENWEGSPPLRGEGKSGRTKRCCAHKVCWK